MRDLAACHRVPVSRWVKQIDSAAPRKPRYCLAAEVVGPPSLSVCSHLRDIHVPIGIIEQASQPNSAV